MDMDLKLTRMDDVTLPESVSDKVQREAFLVLSGAAGLKTGARESLYEHPIATASQLAIGLGITYLSRGKGTCGSLARGAGGFMALTFTNDVLGNGTAVCGALSDNWQSPANWDQNVGVMERSLGRFTFDTLLFATASAGFEGICPGKPMRGTPPQSDNSHAQSVRVQPGSGSEINRNLLNRGSEYFGKGERNPPLITDGPLEVSLYLGLKLSPVTAEQNALASAHILEMQFDGRGSMRHEKYSAKIQFEDGTKGQAIIRAFPHGWADTTRFRVEQSVYHLNKAFQFENGFPVSAPRVYERNGKLYRGWIQEEIGIPLEFGMEALAQRAYGKTTYENIALLARHDARINTQLEQALIERLILGDNDPHSKNMVLTPSRQIQNIDLDFAFQHYYKPTVTSSKAFGVNHMFFLNLEGKPISNGTLAKLDGFMRRYNNADGFGTLESFGLRSGEISSLMRRVEWFTRERVFPEVRCLEL